jgi:hypothetical protein
VGRNTCFYHESLSLLLSKFLLEGRKVLVEAIFVMSSALVISRPCRWGFYERAVFSLVSFFGFDSESIPCDVASFIVTPPVTFKAQQPFFYRPLTLSLSTQQSPSGGYILEKIFTRI